MSGLEVDIYRVEDKADGVSFKDSPGTIFTAVDKQVSKDSFGQFEMSKRVYVRHADLLGALGHLDGFL